MQFRGKERLPRWAVVSRQKDEVAARRMGREGKTAPERDLAGYLLADKIRAY